MNEKQDDLVDLIDNSGNQFKLPRHEFARSMLGFARENWDSLDTLRTTIVQLLQVHCASEALEISNRACELSDDHINDLYWRAVCLAESGELERAGEEFAELQEDSAFPADQARAAVGLAQIKYKLGEPDEAASLLDWAADTSPENPILLDSVYRFWVEFGEPQTGEAKLEQLAHRFPNLAAPFRALAFVAHSKKDIAGLKKNAARAIEQATPEHRDELVAEISYLYGESEMPEEVIKLVEPLIGEIKHPQALMNLAQAYAESGHKLQAIELLQRLRGHAPLQVIPFIDSKLNDLKG